MKLFLTLIFIVKLLHSLTRICSLGII
jgi:hypothetical protein